MEKQQDILQKKIYKNTTTTMEVVHTGIDILKNKVIMLLWKYIVKSKEYVNLTEEKWNGKNNMILREIVKCPYCNKEGGRGSMKRWHFDNCKLKD